MKNVKISRRSFLAASAVSAASFALASCSDTSSSTATSTSTSSSTSSSSEVATLQETTEVTYPVDAQGEKITMWCPINTMASKYMSSYNEHEVFQLISEKTGIEVEFIHPSTGQEAEQLGLLIAGGDLPDIILIAQNYSGGSSAGVDDGAFLDMTDLMPTYAPDYYNAILQSETAYRLATTNAGRITEFAMLKQEAPAFSRLIFLDDVVAKYSMDSMPETIADYETLFEKMAADGLPGYMPAATGINDQFMWPYGICPSFYLDSDYKIQYGQAQPAFKDYLTMMNKWYNSGYINKDFTTGLTTANKQAMFINQQFAMTQDSVDTYYGVADAAGHDIEVANYPRLEAGQYIPYQSVSWDMRPVYGQSTVVTTSCKNPELAMKYLNYLFTEEGADLLNWGIEGVAHTVNADGEREWTDLMINNDDMPLPDGQYVLKMHLFPKLSVADVDNHPNIITNPRAQELRLMYSDDPAIDDSLRLPSFQLDMEASTARQSIMRDIETYVEEMTLKFITGVTSLDEFDNYLATLEGMDIAGAIAITQEQYDLMMAKTLPTV